MTFRLLAALVESEADIVAARQRARQVAAHLGFDEQDQTRVATAVSEIARNAYGHAGGGKVEFFLRRARDGTQALDIVVTDEGPGMAADHPAGGAGQAAATGTTTATTTATAAGGVPAAGEGSGLVGARRLMDDFVIASSNRGTVVRMAKLLPRRAPLLGKDAWARIADELAQSAAVDPVQEVARQNRELLASLEQLRQKQDDLVRLNRELEETNRGVLALYAELDERAEHLRQAHALKTRFLSNVSHEFRTPVNAIIALSRMLMSATDGALSPEQYNQVFYINEAAKGLSELVNDLLDLARIEAGKTEVKAESFTVDELFGTLRGMMKPLIAGDAVAFEVTEAPDLPPLVTDKSKVGQVLRNFLSNAFKFTERGSVQLSATLLDDGVTVRFQVSDTGLGIAPEHLERIFEEFAQLDTPVHHRTKGTGLGLSLSSRLADLLGGRITVSSRPGRGSTFALLIPRCLPQKEAAPAGPEAVAAPAAAEEAPNEMPGGPSGKPLILIVDDEPAARYLMRRMLPPSCSALEAADGRQALTLAREARPKLIILDIVLPGLDGFAILDRLKTDPDTAGIPVVIGTSKVLDDNDRRRLDKADDFLPKNGLDPIHARAILARWIERHDAH